MVKNGVKYHLIYFKSKKTRLLNLILTVSNSKTFVRLSIGDFINSLISGMGSGSIGLYSVSVTLKTATGKDRSVIVFVKTSNLSPF